MVDSLIEWAAPLRRISSHNPKNVSRALLVKNVSQELSSERKSSVERLRQNIIRSNHAGGYFIARGYSRPSTLPQVGER